MLSIEKHEKNEKILSSLSTHSLSLSLNFFLLYFSRRSLHQAFSKEKLKAASSSIIS